MAVRHRLVERPPGDVWAALSDPSRYGEWVVGPSESAERSGRWPECGASLEYTIRLGPWAVAGETIVRHHEPPRHLELEVDSGWLGTARIAIEVRPWGEDTLVIFDEHPLRGPGGFLHNPAVDTVLHLRNRRMLGRLADVVESETRADGSSGEPGGQQRTG
ncbi:SRPBCC family protein [Streptomyces sp. NPDC058773]|uniref:SRPBCC family protein n=1 Tax=Streptomyces sp. NPDC058773 TaxID=3346632 RepID=UPI0036AA141E